MAPAVDLSDLQRAVGEYTAQHNMIVAAGPITAAGLVRTFITKNKLVSSVLVGGGVIIAMQNIAGPMLRLMHDQFGYLIEILGSIRS